MALHWSPPVVLSKREEQIVRGCKKAKLFVFLRQYRHELFDEAIQFGIDEMKREYEAIANNPAAPTWANTIDASEKAGERLNRVLSVFSVMTDNMSNDAYTELDKKWSPKLSAAFDEIRLNPKLFARLETLPVPARSRVFRMIPSGRNFVTCAAS